MADKRRRTAKGAPPKVQKWLDDRRRGMHRGLTPTPEHFQSIWDTSYIPDGSIPATSQLIAEAEARLENVIPSSMREQLLIQNGGCLLKCNPYPFDDASIHWTNATVDGIRRIQLWKRTKEDSWFESVNNVKGLHLLIIIAAHSESHLCLDYRRSGNTGIPGITFVDVCMNPTEVRIITKSADKFVSELIASRRA